MKKTSETNTTIILPHILLRYIISYIKDDIDRMCFVLSCKKIFQDRDKFLTFNKQIDKNNTNFKFNSFRKQFSTKSSFGVFVNEYSIYFEYFLNGLIPNNVTHLYISLNSPLKQGLIPESVRRLEFSDDFNQIISPFILTSSIETIVFGFSYNKKIEKNVIPNSCKTIKFGECFDQPIDINTLPESITSIKFGGSFNQQLIPHSLPSRLKILKFGARFNSLILPNTLPASLKSLSFHHSFNQPLTTSIPVQKLSFGTEFNQILVADLLIGVKSLKLSDNFNQPLEGSLPPTLTKLVLGNSFNQPITVDSLPSSLETITFGNQFNQPINPNFLPKSLRSITFGERFNQSLYNLSLDSITIGDNFNQTLFSEGNNNNIQYIYININNRFEKFKDISSLCYLENLPTTSTNFIIRFKGVDTQIRILDENSTIVLNLNRFEGGLIDTKSFLNRSFFNYYSNYLELKLKQPNNLSLNYSIYNNNNNNNNNSNNNEIDLLTPHQFTINFGDWSIPDVGDFVF